MNFDTTLVGHQHFVGPDDIRTRPDQNTRNVFFQFIRVRMRRIQYPAALYQFFQIVFLGIVFQNIRLVWRQLQLVAQC